MQADPKANICHLCLLFLCQVGVFEMSEFGVQAVLNPTENVLKLGLL